MDKNFIPVILCVFILGMVLQHIIDSENKNCTVTITDMRGVQHVITGKADET